LIATAPTKGPALTISKGIDRDRAVDESGNQLAVFGRRGARPLNRAETQRLYLKNGQLYTVTDEPVEHLRFSKTGENESSRWFTTLRFWLLN
jgi:hypothetical protein